MIYCPEKYIKPSIDLNQAYLALEGELEDEESKITLAKFLRANIGFTVELISGIKLAPYQEIAIKAMLNRDFILNVWGRGLSKCLRYGPETRLLTKNLGFCDITKAVPNVNFSIGERWMDIDELELWNGESWQKTNKIYLQPQKDCVRVNTNAGHFLEGSVNHLVKVLNPVTCEIEWKKLSEIKEGDSVCISRNSIEEWNKEEVDDDECYLVGLLIGDGCISPNRRDTRITNMDKEILDFCQRYTPGKLRSPSKTSQVRELGFPLVFATYLLEKYQVKRELSYSKEIPPVIMKSKRALKHFLSGLFDTDGTANSHVLQVSFCTTSVKLAREVHLALSLFGVISTFKQHKTANSPFGKHWKVSAWGPNAIQFHNEIGFRLTRKRDLVQKHIDADKFLNPNKDVIPGARDLAKKIKKTFPKDKVKGEWDKTLNQNGLSISYRKLKKYIDYLDKRTSGNKDLDNLKIIQREHFYFDKVTGIESFVGDCIDFNVPNGEKYWCNGFINHNSFCSAIYCFLQMIFEPGTKIVIAGPTFRTARNIFNELEKIVNSPAAVLLQQCLSTAPSKRPDVLEWDINGGTIRAIPLNGEKIRGFRASVLLLDEYLLLSENIVNTVLKPFLLSPKNLARRIEVTRLEDQLVKDGKLKNEDRTVFKNDAKMICLSSASYTFENLYKTYEDWVAQIYDENSKGEGTYFVSQIGYEGVPDYMVDSNVIEEAKNGGASHSTFQREYLAWFVDDSDSYFSAKKMKECTIPDGQQTTTLLKGRKDKKYVLAVDPNYSASKSADFFAMAVLELIEDEKKFILVHNYAVAGGDLKDHHKYLYYILTNFNIVLAVCDNAGFRELLSANDSVNFTKNNIKLQALENFDSMAEGIDYIEQLRLFRGQYNLEDKKILFAQVFQTSFIRRANEYLQACIDHKRLWFASKISAHDEIFDETIKSNASFPTELTPFANIGEAIEAQDELIDNVKKQCALIEVKNTPTGGQSFDIPSHLSRDRQNINRARKDNYSALMLCVWCAKIYFDMNETPPEPTNETFMPFFAR